MTTGLDVFDTTVQETNLWLKDVMERICTYDRHSASGCLCTFAISIQTFGRDHRGLVIGVSRSSPQ